MKIIVKTFIITVKTLLIQLVFFLFSSSFTLAEANFLVTPTLDASQIVVENLDRKSLVFRCLSSRSFDQGKDEFSWMGKTATGDNFLTFARTEESIRGSIIALKDFQIQGIE